MKSLYLIALAATLPMAGCASSKKNNPDPGTFAGISDLSAGTMSKLNSLVVNSHLAVYEIGDLAINIRLPKDVDISKADVYLDDFYIGNLNETKVKLRLKRGLHTIMIQLPGCKPYSNEFMLLGNPNKQTLNVYIEKEKK